MKHISQSGNPVPNIIVAVNKVTAVSNIPNRLQVLLFAVLRYGINIHHNYGSLVMCSISQVKCSDLNCLRSLYA
jgi:hypothetical protein